MADRYIDVAYVQACLELSTALSLADVTADINLFIEAATAEVQGLMRNSGYDVFVPAVPVVIANVHPTIRDAVMCGVWERMAMRPRYSLELPANWADLPYRRALDGIETGELQLGSGQSTSSAPGGWLFTDVVTRSGRGKLSGY